VRAPNRTGRVEARDRGEIVVLSARSRTLGSGFTAFEAQASSERHRFETPSRVNRRPSKRQSKGWVPTVTVVLAGLGELGQIRAFLALGAVVVIAPDDETLRAWIGENMASPSPKVDAQESNGLSIQTLARRVMFEGQELPLTDLDYRILTFLASEPERAWSFHQIRQAAWGPSPDLLADAFSVRSAVQRLRRKLQLAAAPVVIESVRSFGFRLVRASGPIPMNGKGTGSELAGNLQ
jgi:DNA-binding winged helix-turn-helix (wHTH) protein